MTPTVESVVAKLSGPNKFFAYLSTERASLYRAIMQVFIAAKGRLVFQLSSQQVLECIPATHLSEPPNEETVMSALSRLCGWGNLQTVVDSRNASAVEDFYNPRRMFEMTNSGEAAERAVSGFGESSVCETEFHAAAVGDLRLVLQDLQQLSRQAEPDAGKLYRNLLAFRALFDDLSSAAPLLIGALDQASAFGATGTRDSIGPLIESGRRFVDELVLESDCIGMTIQDIGEAGFERLLQALTDRSIRRVVQAPPDVVERVCEQWRLLWQRLQDWFVSQPGLPSAAERLRESARASIPLLIHRIATASDQQRHRIDRAADFKALARWFAQAESDAEAHLLWRAAFGLCPARHLIINEASLDDREAQDLPLDTSWLEAPPLQITGSFPGYRGNARTSGLSRIIDRSAEKEKLAAASREEAQRLLNAQRRFSSGNRIRLSELEHLEPDEFDLLLDLLGETVSARVFAGDSVEILSGDGRLKLKLEPTDDGREALILTTQGMFSGPDHWIHIEPVLSDELLEVLM